MMFIVWVVLKLSSRLSFSVSYLSTYTLSLIYSCHQFIYGVNMTEWLENVLKLQRCKKSLSTGETFRSTRYDASPCIITALTFLTILPRYQLKLTEQYPAPNGLYSNNLQHNDYQSILLIAIMFVRWNFCEIVAVRLRNLLHWEYTAWALIFFITVEKLIFQRLLELQKQILFQYICISNVN